MQKVKQEDIPDSLIPKQQDSLELITSKNMGMDNIGTDKIQVAMERLQETASLAPGLIYQFILRKDGSMALPYANAGIFALFRVTPEEVREDASRILALIHPDDRDDVLASLFASAQEMTPWRKKFRVRFNDGSVLKLYALSTPKNAADESILWHGMIIDITDLANSHQELVQPTKTVAPTGITQNHLLSILAYEFRSPLSLLFSSTEIIDRYSRDLSADKLAVQHTHIRTATKQLSELLDSILVYCQEDRECATHSTATMDCGLACQNIAREVTAHYGEKYHTNVAIADNCGMAVMDESLLRLVLKNLLSNAFRFTPPGGDISFHVIRENRRLLVEITDSGIGIPEEDQERIFEPFQCSSNATGYHGLGLGLSNAQSALSQMGGTILLSSKVGEGTNVRVEIPLVAKEDLKIANSIYSILIIEDNQLLNSNMALVLQLEGYRVRTANDGLSGLAMIRDQQPDLILCDISMPGIDGHQLLETIKEDLMCADIFFVFVTALIDQAHMRRGMLAGADDYLVKPFGNAKLLATVSGCLNKLKIIRAQRPAGPDVSQEDSTLLQAISHRELEVLVMVGQGLSSKDIADQLFISLKTVEAHRSHLMKKLKATNAVGLARWAAMAEQLQMH